MNYKFILLLLIFKIKILRCWYFLKPKLVLTKAVNNGFKVKMQY